jgi:hypothetical protein
MTLPLFAGYFGRFLDHWSVALKTQNAIVMTVVVVGCVGVAIITFGVKMKK